MKELLHPMVDRKQRDRQKEAREKIPPRAHTHDLVPPVRPPCAKHSRTSQAWWLMPIILNYFRRWRLGGLQFEGSTGKKCARPTLINSWTQWCTLVISNYLGKHK
jgi:hypothetical protein